MKASVAQGALDVALRNQPTNAGADPDVLSTDGGMRLCLTTLPPDRMLSMDVDRLHVLGWEWDHCEQKWRSE